MLPLSSRARWQVAVWDHMDKKLLHIVPGPHLCGGTVSEITGVASWRVPEASAFAECPHFVVSLDSLRTRAPARATRGAYALSSQASARGSPISQRLSISSGEGEGPLSGRDGSSAATPAACLLVRVDHTTGQASLCRQLSLFDTADGMPPSASDDDEAEQNWQCVASRCASVSCHSRYIAGGFSSGTVALWSASSARLVALLRDPRASGSGSGPGSAAGGGRGRPSMPGVRCVAVHPEQRVVAAGRSDGWVDVWAG